MKSRAPQKQPKRVAIIGLPVLRSMSTFNAILMQYAEENGHWEFVFSSESAIGPLRFLRKIDCDGAIVRIISKEMRKEALRINFPMVNISGWLADPGVPSVRSDNQALGRLCAEHLLARGFRRFGIVRLWGGWYADERITGFLKSVRAAGSGENVSTFEICSRGETIGDEDMKRFRAWLPTLRLPAALLLTDDLNIQVLLDACRDEGLRVPEDIAVIAAHRREDKIDGCEPQVTGVDWAEPTVAL